ncbi:MAG TPA: exopolysaccharide biosynthesis polyprenyl glycosylphosphotransferase [Terriglobales bacterium]|nr:exopolysaccharide biosynthesis polyprenyl glycosylphosphotransferase [Terriglobales bacterium]
MAATSSIASRSTPAREARSAALRSHLKGAVLGVALDLILLALGFVLAFALRGVLGGVMGAYRWAPGAAVEYLTCAGIFLAVLLYEGVYEPGIVGVGQTERLVKALTGGLIVSIFFTFVMHTALAISRPVLVFWYLFNVALFALVRPVVRRRSADVGRVAVLAGSSAATDTVAKGLRMSGLRPRIFSDAGDSEMRALAAKSLCLVPSSSVEADADCVLRLERDFPLVGVVPARGEGLLFGATPVNLRGLQVYVLQQPLRRWANRAIKRGFDLAFASALLILVSPLLAVIAAAIRMDSGGPVLFAHHRLGRREELFRVWKFRTMCADADRRLESLLADNAELRAEFAANFKLKSDPRVTRVGRFLRRTSLDELPQLWNIIRGEMSLVGPRPIVSAERELYGPAYELISQVRPGLTGVWQTSGRNDVGYESRPHLDLFYVRHWSLWLDLAVLVRTVQALLLPDGY